MKKHLIILLSFVFVVFITGNGFAFRCGSELISIGETKIHTIKICGQPTLKEKTCLERNTLTGICINEGEAWYYDCGESDFIYVLNFGENSRLISVQTGGQGSGVSICNGRALR